MRVILVRHGQTHANVAGELDTAVPGSALTELGQRQAAAAAVALGAEQIASVYSSDRRRATETAAPLAHRLGLDAGVLPGLGEIDAAELEMRSDPDSVTTYNDTVVAWMAGQLDRGVPGGEDGQAFLDRFTTALDEIVASHADDAVVVAVSHGAAMRVFLGRIEGYDLAQARQHFFANTGSMIVELSGDGWRLVDLRPEPLGGRELLDASAHDVTGADAED